MRLAGKRTMVCSVSPITPTNFTLKSTQQEKNYQNDEVYETRIWPNVKYLHEARSRDQFDALAKLSLGQLVRLVCYSGYNFLPKALESHHRVFETSCVGVLRASTATVLNEALPDVLLHQSKVATQLAQAHSNEGNSTVCIPRIEAFTLENVSEKLTNIFGNQSKASIMELGNGKTVNHVEAVPTK
ncbi:hypothetical protein DVH05_026458 [Phytophthora capsici]|nr:hypothetical protein DVH05_026458 [Phytophthora capsici]